MNWSALTKKQQYMVFGTVILAVVQVVFVIHFLMGKTGESAGGKSAKAELEELQEKVDEARLVIAKTEMVKSTLLKTVEKLDELSVHTPTLADQYAWAYEYVSLRAAKAGVELDSLEEISYVGDEEKPPEEQSYEIRLSTRCGYNQLVEFLWRIEQDNPLLRVKDVDISMIPDTMEQQQVRLMLQWPTSLQIERGDLM